MLKTMLPAFVACLVLVAVHAYLGLHVIAREVIFVDLSIAQMAALGGVTALLVGVERDSPTAYAFSLAFTAVGAALFAATRTSEKGRVPQEAFIGIIYVVASAAAILVADKAPRGAEVIHDVLVGNILFVTWPTILKKTAGYVALGVFFYLFRERFHTISFQPEEAVRRGWSVRWWDFWFYLAFGIAITLSVPIAGVLMVFTILVVPSTIAFLFTRDMRRLTVVSWTSGALASLLGIGLSYQLDLPTGPMIVCMFGVVLLGAAVLKRLGIGLERA